MCLEYYCGTFVCQTRCVDHHRCVIEEWGDRGLRMTSTMLLMKIESICDDWPCPCVSPSLIFRRLLLIYII